MSICSQEQRRCWFIYFHFTDNGTILRPIVHLEVDLFQSRSGVICTKISSWQSISKFLKHLTYLGEVKPEKSKNDLQYQNIGRKKIGIILTKKNQ